MWQKLFQSTEDDITSQTKQSPFKPVTYANSKRVLYHKIYHFLLRMMKLGLNVSWYDVITTTTEQDKNLHSS